MKTVLVLLFAVMTFSPAMLHADTVDYLISGTLDDGGIFSGSFTLDSNSPDLESATGRGEFELADFEFTLTDTSLFMSGGNTATSGSATSISLFQNEFSSESTLVIDLVSDSGSGGVFTDIEFVPFVGDADTLQFLDPAAFNGGFFDGAGGANIVTFNLEIVPEPTSALLLIALAPIACSRRKR